MSKSNKGQNLIPDGGEGQVTVIYRSIRRWIAAGRINAVRVGPKLLKVNAADVDALKRPVGGAA